MRGDIPVYILTYQLRPLPSLLHNAQRPESRHPVRPQHRCRFPHPARSHLYLYGPTLHGQHRSNRRASNPYYLSLIRIPTQFAAVTQRAERSVRWVYQPGSSKSDLPWKNNKLIAHQNLTLLFAFLQVKEVLRCRECKQTYCCCCRSHVSRKFLKGREGRRKKYAVSTAFAGYVCMHFVCALQKS